VLLALTVGLPRPALVPIGPGFYPRIVLVVTAVLSAALVVSDLRARKGAAPAPAASGGHLVVATFAIFTGYVVVLPYLGYRLATLAFMVLLQATLASAAGRVRWPLVVAMAVVTTVVTYYVFEAYLSVLLPRGRLTGF
jgi:hypothetical protein